MHSAAALPSAMMPRRSIMLLIGCGSLVCICCANPVLPPPIDAPREESDAGAQRMGSYHSGGGGGGGGAGFTVGNGTFLLDGAPIRLFAGSLQHFRIHPAHWEHRLSLARYAGLNAVQTLIPWFMMEPSPGAFVTDGFADIVRFAKLCAKLDLKIILRPGPFICDGPDFGGLPWWLAQQGPAATTLPGQPAAYRLRVRTSDPSYMHRVRCAALSLPFHCPSTALSLPFHCLVTAFH